MNVNRIPLERACGVDEKRPVPYAVDSFNMGVFVETFAELVEMRDAPVVVADHNGIISGVNRCFEETFNWSEERLIGNLLTDIMPERFRDSHSMGMSRFLTTESRTLPEHALDLDVLCGDGTIVKSRHTIVADKTDGIWRFAGKIEPLKTDG